jgi:hypothetical protein
MAVIDAAVRYIVEFRRAQNGVGSMVVARSQLAIAVDEYAKHGLAAPSKTRTSIHAPDTSHEAGEYMKQFALTDAGAVFAKIYFAWRRSRRLQERMNVYRGTNYPVENDGLTTEEVEEALERKHQSISPRVNELRDTGWLVDSGERRKTSSGRNAIVWTPTQAALEAVDEHGLPIVVEVPADAQ